MIASFFQNLFGGKKKNKKAPQTSANLSNTAHEELVENAGPIEASDPFDIPAAPAWNSPNTSADNGASPTPSPAAPTAIDPEQQKRDYYIPDRTFGGKVKPGKTPPPQYTIPNNLNNFGDQCTIVYFRHGTKYGRNGGGPVNDLTPYGRQEGEYLSTVLQGYQRQYGKFDRVITSAEKRAMETATPFIMDSKIPGEKMASTNECEGNSDCDKKVDSFINNVLPSICKKRPDGKPSTIVMSGHGSFGVILLRRLTGNEGFKGGLEYARPNVITRSVPKDNPATKVDESKAWKGTFNTLYRARN